MCLVWLFVCCRCVCQCFVDGFAHALGGVSLRVFRVYRGMFLPELPPERDSEFNFDLKFFPVNFLVSRAYICFIYV